MRVHSSVDGRSFFPVLFFEDQLVDSDIDSIPHLDQHPFKLQGQSHFAFNPVLRSSCARRA